MSRLAIEVKPGVFVATFNARVRDEIWKKICNEWNVPSIMMFSSNTEQGYRILSYGDPEREVNDFDGILLLSKPQKKQE